MPFYFGFFEGIFKKGQICNAYVFHFCSKLNCCVSEIISKSEIIFCVYKYDILSWHLLTILAQKLFFSMTKWTIWIHQSYEIKFPPWTILWFRILGIFSVENIKRVCFFMFQTYSNNQLCTEKSTVNQCRADYWSKFET